MHLSETKRKKKCSEQKRCSEKNVQFMGLLSPNKPTWSLLRFRTKKIKHILYPKRSKCTGNQPKKIKPYRKPTLQLRNRSGRSDDWVAGVRSDEARERNG